MNDESLFPNDTTEFPYTSSKSNALNLNSLSVPLSRVGDATKLKCQSMVVGFPVTESIAYYRWDL